MRIIKQTGFYLNKIWQPISAALPRVSQSGKKYFFEQNMVYKRPAKVSRLTFMEGQKIRRHTSTVSTRENFKNDGFLWEQNWENGGVSCQFIIVSVCWCVSKTGFNCDSALTSTSLKHLRACSDRRLLSVLFSSFFPTWSTEYFDSRTGWSCR